MRATDFIIEALNWNTAQQEAQSKGLILEPRSGNAKKYGYILSIPQEKYKHLEDKVDDNFFSHMNHKTWIVVNNLKSFPGAIAELEKTLKVIQGIESGSGIEKDLGKEDFYAWLQKQYQDSLSETSHLRANYQLYVPRDASHKPHHVDKNQARASSWTYDFDDKGEVYPAKRKEYGLAEDLKGALLPGVSQVKRPGGSKPSAQSFWTSSARKVRDYWTSEWVERVVAGSPDWWNEFGYLYKINSQARILRITGDHDIFDIAKHYQKRTGDYYKITRGSDWDNPVRSKFPWDQITQHWDAVYVPHPDHSMDYGLGFTYGWDCESTVWFNPRASLTLVGKVRIAPLDSRYSDEED